MYLCAHVYVPKFMVIVVYVHNIYVCVSPCMHVVSMSMYVFYLYVYLLSAPQTVCVHVHERVCAQMLNQRSAIAGLV